MKPSFYLSGLHKKWNKMNENGLYPFHMENNQALT